MPLQIPVLGILLAAALTLILLFLLGPLGGAALAVLLTLILLGVLDFFIPFLHSGALIVGEILGFLLALGVWFMLTLVGVVH